MATPNAVLTELPGDGVLTPEMLAREYNPQSYADAFESVEDYRRVQQRHSKTGKKSSALARELDMPRGRIRAWLNGAAPDPGRAIAVGIEHDWFDDSHATTTAWAVLVLGTVAGGSIAEANLNPYWTTEPLTAGDRVANALATLGLETAANRREGRPDQIRPAEHGPVVGRALVALGCAVGDTNADAPPLPEWLLEQPVNVREAACEVLVLYRGVGYDNKDTVRLQGDRSAAFRDSVVALFNGVVDGDVIAGERGVTISAAAARELGIGRDGPLRSAIEPE